jgi:tetratricopeptide (TPR) repeat protein
MLPSLWICVANNDKSISLMKNLLHLFFLSLIVFILLSVSACDNAAENGKNELLRTGSIIGNSALQESIAACTRAISLDPKSAKAYASRGAFKYAMGDGKGAIRDLTKAIELNPKSAASYSGRGSAKLAAGDLPGAVADFVSVARLMLFSTPDSESGSDSGKDSGKESGNNAGKELGKGSDI